MAEQDYQGFLNKVYHYSAKPPLFEPGEKLFWDDSHISKSMLEAHLNPDNDLASRRPATIDKEVNHLVSSGTLKPGFKVLDLGCGPGLYASRLAEKGMKVTGVDISERSLNYAIAQAKEKGLDIEYRLLSFFDIDYSGEFDAAIQAYGEIGTYSAEKRGTLLTKIHKALKPGGRLVFDVTAGAQALKEGPQNHWYIMDGGFWRPGRNLVLDRQFDYPENNVHVDQSIVIDEENISVYRTWIHHYTLESIKPVLLKAGFEIIHAWNDLTGTPYQEGGEWLAIVAARR